MSEPRYIEGQYQYEDGYRSDYKFKTAAQARFYDQFDVMCERAQDDGHNMEDIDGWLMDLASREIAP